MNEFLEQFLIESRELVEQATGDLLALEDTPEDQGRLDGAFRGFHTLKGAAGIVDFPAMGRVLHAAEDVLAAVRAGDHPVTADLVGGCLACLDQVVQWLDVIEATGDLPVVTPDAADAMAAEFSAVSTLPPVPAGDPAQGAPDWIRGLLARYPAERPQVRVALRYVPDPGCFFRGEDPLALIAGLPGLLALELTPREPWPPLERLDPFACNLVITALTGDPAGEVEDLLRRVVGEVQIRAISGGLAPDARAVLEEQLHLAAEDEVDGFPGRIGSAGLVAARVLQHAGWTAEALAVQESIARSQAAGAPAPFLAALGAVLHPAPTRSVPAASGAPAVQETAVRALRVEVGRIDALVKLTGELTVVKNAVGYATRLAQDKADLDLLAQTLKDQHMLLDRLVGELQRSVLGIRVLPFRHVFQRFPKLVREMAQTLGKSARLVTEGETTEADKAIVEALFEPLVHVIRNALDHGIEDAEGRRAAGKPAAAIIGLRADRDGDHVIVEVTDDGRGIDVAKIRKVAAQHDLATTEALAAMTDDELAELIFTPGFSTSAAVTGVSGRGVGMDAVRSAIARMGGRVSVRTRPGEGTAVLFTLPFTVMMSRVMTVEAGSQVFGIPFESVVETVRLTRRQIHPAGAAQMFVLRDRTVPLISLADALGLTRGAEDRDTEANIVVATVGGLVGALEVDRFGGWLDVMLKPMEGLLAGMGGVTGTTLLGDGRVLIVLNLQDLLS